MDENSTPRRRPSKVTDEELLAALPAAANMRQLLESLGIAPYGGNYGSVRARLIRLTALDHRFDLRAGGAAPRLRELSDDELAMLVADARTKADVLRNLGFCAGGGYRQLNERLLAAGIDTQHMQDSSWTARRQSRGRPLTELLVRGSKIQSYKLRDRLLRAELYEARCACCGIDTWLERAAPLELDHIDGDRTNNELGNLRLLCPNCHALTDTYRGRNVGRPHGARPSPLSGAEERRLAAVGRLRTIVGTA